MGNSQSEMQPPLVILNPEFPMSVTPAFLEIVKVYLESDIQDPSKAKTWVERQVELERERDTYSRTIAESKTVANVTREALDTIKNFELFQIDKSLEAINAKNNLEKCYALGKPLNCDEEVAEFKKIASSF